MPDYKRYLGPKFIKKLKGDYSFLLQCSKKKEGGYKYDVQLRPNNEIMIYYGGTCLLTVGCDELTGDINFSSKSYASKASSFSLISPSSPLNKIKKACNNFLNEAASTVTPTWNKPGSEGYCEQRISRLWGGPAWQESMDILVIDRQAVISFDSDLQKTKFYKGIKRKYLSKVADLRYQEGWKEKNTFGDELDLLAIGPDGELLCIELKTGKTDKGFYYAPFQAAAYCEAFKSASPDISNDIKTLVKQKITLGLLPSTAAKRLKEGSFKVKSLLLIMHSEKLSLESDVWPRLNDVAKSINKSFRPLIRAIP